MAKLLEWIIRVEEQGMDGNGYIPESARARAITAELDVSNRKARVGCKVMRHDGGLELKEDWIEW